MPDGSLLTPSRCGCDHAGMKKLVLLFASATFAVCAQSADNSLSVSTKALYGFAKNNVTKGADKMPEANYGFKPSPDVRSFGQLIGHIADANYMFCSAVVGEKPPVSDIEKTKTSKADLVRALNESFAYCDKAYDGMTDTAAVEKIKVIGREFPKLAVLNLNNMHEYEHYGNMVTYLRMKGIVPPSSEPRK
jgi:uncharacterized damage-inducible protein DinB